MRYWLTSRCGRSAPAGRRRAIRRRTCSWAWGGAAWGSFLGARGWGTFLSGPPAVLAPLFFLLSLALAYVATHRAGDDGSVVDRVPAKAKPAAEAQKPAAEPQKPAPPAEAPSGKEVPR